MMISSGWSKSCGRRRDGLAATRSLRSGAFRSEDSGSRLLTVRLQTAASDVESGSSPEGMESGVVAGDLAEQGQDGVIEFGAVLRRIVGQLAPLDMVPQELDGVQFGGVRR